MTLKEFSPGGDPEFSLVLPPGATLDEVLRELKVPSHWELVLLRNGRVATAASPLNSGDRVDLMLAVAGG